MRRSTALRAALLAAAAAVAGVLAWTGGDPPPPPPPPPAPPPAPAPPPPPPPTDGPPIVLPPPPAPPPRIPSQGFIPSGLPEWDFEVPEGEEGPVVVGRVTKAGDSDPDCWIALESAADPGRAGRSVLGSFNDGGFRLTGLPEGRYRVRARMEGAAAVYSEEFDAVPGVVVDAGLLVLRNDGAIAGVVLDPAGEAADAVVNLFGRDPATLKPRIVATARAVGRQGFQLPPHETGPFTLSVVGDAGWALVEGASDDAGLAWMEVRLRAYGRIAIDALPEGVQPVGVTLEARSVPDLGSRPPRLTAKPGETLERVLPGKWLATFHRGWGATGKEFAVEEGKEFRLDPR